jgi:hypothetical protein
MTIYHVFSGSMHIITTLDYAIALSVLNRFPSGIIVETKGEYIG